MEKLEGILRAEEGGRMLLRDAGERAALLLAEARAEAAAIDERGRAASLAAATDLRERAAREAASEAASIEAAGDRERADLLAAAQTRLPAAIDAVVRGLTG